MTASFRPKKSQRFRAQILSNLIDETLQIQEAAANEVEVTQDEVDRISTQVAQQNFKRNPADTEKYLQSIGSSSASLKRQIQAEMTWSRLLARKVTSVRQYQR